MSIRAIGPRTAVCRRSAAEARHFEAFAVRAAEELVGLAKVGELESLRVPLQRLRREAIGDHTQKQCLGERTGIGEAGCRLARPQARRDPLVPVVAILMAPLLHRFLHEFHLEMSEDDEER